MENPRITTEKVSRAMRGAALLGSLPQKAPPTGRADKSASKRFYMCMNQADLHQELKAVGMSLEDACQAIFYDTGAVVRPKNVRKQFQRNGHLSQIYSATFGYFFRERCKQRRRNRAVS